LIAALSGPLLLLWGGASLALALGLLRAGIGLRRRARGWRATVVDGTEVLVAPDIGPAVVRLGGLRVVLPEWALSAEPAARSLMLLHENEHCRARDPDLLLGGTVALMLVPWALPLWWQVRRLQLAVETDCDRRVMCDGADAHAYGALLLSVGARAARQPLLAPTAFSEKRSLLERRIEAMTSPTSKWRFARTVLATGVSALGVAAACVTPRPAAAPAPRPAPATTPQPGAASSPITVTATRQRGWVYALRALAREDRPTLLSSGPLRIPDSLRTIEGRVVLQWVIDTTGHAAPGSLRVLSSSHQGFEAVAREQVLGSMWRPGRIDGRAVAVQFPPIPMVFPVAPGGAVVGFPAEVAGPVTEPAAVPVAALPPGVYAEDGVTERPQRLSSPPARYPDSLRTAGIGGRVLVEVIVDSTGHADSASVRVLSTTHPGFEAPARDVVLGTTFAPGRLHGRAVPVMVRIPINFVTTGP
jgi:TonB family protein